MNPSHIFRMTHILNIDIFLNDGFLYAPNYRNQPQYSVSYDGINQRRGTMTLPNGRALHDYVPFYFSPLTPMAYTISQGNLSLISPNQDNLGRVNVDDIVFCVLNLETVYRIGYECKVSTSACNNFAYEICDDIQQADINWQLFNEYPIKASIPEEGYGGACAYFHDRDSIPYQNRRAVRGAEFLIADKLDVNHIDFFVVKNDEIAFSVRQKLSDKGFGQPVYVKSDCYY
ncbi:DarT ssDNA thymidine ADP-ribosyltransferase family protein [Hydrogenovibrio sp. JE_KL2]|uniref:DarT ssDNA thymidine ADP-ribosyltransferase family protein n=1 Tax=Hydrogenovibrio sp. JE_KL2 TaxID=2651188 RepID=UPI00128DB672|nr:DarT ssDNA thymidine ADP-ribosyltransferase family protein [Hydrogenovibrio sp. JE_KL2]MPQ76660.1 DUF4433 domain-containing protein [Hydrogenovibrio sp. JE_KL2]